MKLLFTTLREKSHLMAFAPFVEASVRDGHQVAVAAPIDMAAAVAALGARVSIVRPSRRRQHETHLGALPRRNARTSRAHRGRRSVRWCPSRSSRVSNAPLADAKRTPDVNTARFGIALASEISG
jgi:hypothetical protein